MAVLQKMKLKTVALELTEPILLDELVERCKQGDNRSFAALYSKYAKAMYNTSLGSSTIPETPKT